MKTDTRVECYWNLHKNCLSARPTVKGGKVWHADMVWLTDVRFAVQPAGNAKVRAEGRKNVHAYVRGTVVNWQGLLGGAPVDAETVERLGWVRVSYNPYRYESFVLTATGEPILAAREAFIASKQIWALL